MSNGANAEILAALNSFEGILDNKVNERSRPQTNWETRIQNQSRILVEFLAV
jgi:hypothetical protein